MATSSTKVAILFFRHVGISEVYYVNVAVNDKNLENFDIHIVVWYTLNGYSVMFEIFVS